MRSLYLGRAFGIPLYIHWTFLLLPLWVLFLTSGEPVATKVFTQVVLLSLFGCVLLHELGHALMARYFRIATRDITLYPIGGVARLESTGREPHQEVAIALAGPAVNLVLLLLFAPLLIVVLVLGQLPSFSGDSENWSVAMSYLISLCAGNAVLLLFNLIPAFPMDGGRVLRAVLTVPLGVVRATAVAASIGLVLGIAMAIAGLTILQNPSLVLVSAFVVFAGQAELKMLRRQEALQRQEQQRVHEAGPIEVLVRMGDPLDPRQPLRPVGQLVPYYRSHDESGSDGSGSDESRRDERESNGSVGFTGFLWDPREKVWVRWVDGKREDVF